MLNAILIIISMYGLSFILKESDIFSSVRNYLMRSKYAGVFFYGLFSCYACIGFWSGMFIFILDYANFFLSKILIWGFAGSAISFIINNLLLQQNEEV